MADKDIKDVMDEELENEELTEDAEAAEAENVSEEASEDKAADETLEDDASAETEDKDSDDKKDGLFKKKKKKTDTSIDISVFFVLVIQEGFEPPTPGLEGLCSIQLSY